MISNNYLRRSVENYAFDESLTGRHMIFLAGPRQAGKTRLAREWLRARESSPLYFNWDDFATRRAYAQDSRFFESAARTLGVNDPWIVFDEIHKRRNWRDILKGAYDIFQDDFRFLITGSARLDLFRKSGDFLIGRYNLFHLFPFSIHELLQNTTPDFLATDDTIETLARKFELRAAEKPALEILEAYNSLLQFGPFPEPLLRQNDRFCRKWHMDYFSLVVREDLREISRIVELDKIEKMLLLMPGRIGSPLSMPGLARDIEAAHTSVKSWLEQLKRLYLVFEIRPWFRKINRGLKKEKKWYFLDWYYVSEPAARLENMVAVHLYRYCLALADEGYGEFTLHYVRTLDKKEIDFLVVRNNRPLLAVEVKTGDKTLSPALQDRHKWFGGAATLGIQVVDRRGVLKKYPENTWMMSIERFLNIL